MHSLKRNLTYLFVSILFLSTLSLMANCGSGGGGGTTGATKLAGTIALNDGSVGTLNVTIQSTVASTSWFSIIREAEAQSTTVPATGDCVSPTCTIPNLSGDYDPSTGEFNISGPGTGSGCGGATTTFTGAVTPPTSGGGSSSGGGMSGTIQDSSGSSIGGFSGVFTTSSTGGAVSYCGIAVADAQDAFNVTIAANGDLAGVAQPLSATSGDKGATFIGKATGSTFTACTTSDSTPSPICGVIGADGSINGKFIRNDSAGGEGCFTGDSSVCTTGTLPPPCSGPTAACTYPTCP